MRGFEYARPASVEQAVRLLAAAPERSRLLAGGSDLLSLMKDEVEAPERLISLQAIRPLRGLHADPRAGLRIGALVTLAELAADGAARRLHPVLSTAAGQAAGPQIRNVGTVVGNLCQRPRCWYFRTGYGLLAMRDGKSMVPEGDNRFHAILGNGGPAYFVQPSTVAPLLIVLGARLVVAGPKGERQLDLAGFYRTPQHEAESEHALAPGEIVTEIVVPPPAERRRVWSYEVRQRHTLDWSLATAAVALDMQGKRVERARVVVGQVAPIPWEAVAAQRLLHGQELDAAVAARAGEAAVEGARPLSRNRYKVQLARVAVKRALLAAGGIKEA